MSDLKNPPFLSSLLENTNKIESIVSSLRNLSSEKPIGNAVLYFWESHTGKSIDKKKIQATIDLIYKKFDIATCETYEIRTGYLSRYNYLTNPIYDSTETEIKNAISKGKDVEAKWIKQCDFTLPGFIEKDWKECISSQQNSYFEQCVHLVTKKIETDQDFATAFLKSVNKYAAKHGTNVINGKLYILEEISWMLTLPLLHLNKPIYLVHVDESNAVITAMFHHFPHLQKAVKWLSPQFKTNIFENLSDFLLAYRNGAHLGYSYAIENKECVKEITYFKKEEMLTKEELINLIENERSEKNLLRSIIGKLPGHVYWLNRNNIYLGCNDTQAKSFGLDSHHNIMGKTNYDLLPEKEANELNETNKRVMETGVVYEGEELASMSGKYGNYLSQKVPLHDENGKIIGLLGVSIDITDRKRAEDLEFLNKLQKIRIQEQEDFRSFTGRVAHDITSPLISLESLMKTCHEIPEESHKALRSIVASIRNISHTLLDRYKKDQRALYDEQEQYILIPLALEEVINHKKYQYQGKSVSFHYFYDSRHKFTFIKGDQSNFSRMISNLISNAVEAAEDKEGIISIAYKVENEAVYIVIQDNGKGMPPETVNKIINHSTVETTKKEGHGIGLGQVLDTLKLYQGKIEIESLEGKGTKITLKFHLVSPPKWIADKVTLHKGDTIVVLDDDSSIFSVWKKLLNSYKKDLSVKFFTNSQEAIDFIDNSYEKEKIFFLSDYELRNDNMNGLRAVLQSGIQNRALLVTNIHNDKYIYDLAEQSEIKILPKQFLQDIPISIEST